MLTPFNGAQFQRFSSGRGMAGGGGGAAPGYPTVQATSVDNLFTKYVIMT